MHAGAGEDGGRSVGVDLARAPLDVQADGRGDLHVRRHADTDLLDVARRSPRRLLSSQLGIARCLERGIQRLLVLARVVVGPGDGGARERVGLHEVDPADLGRVDADLVGGDVEHALDQLRRLGAPGAAVGPDGGVVGEHGLGVEAHLRDLVHADRHHLRQQRQDRADRRIGTGRRLHLAVEADDLAVVVHAETSRHDVVAAVHQRHHVFGAALGPLHRLAEGERRLAGDEVLDVGGRLRAEPAAHPRADDSQLGRVEAEHRGVPAVDRVRCLVRHPHREAAVGRDRDDAVVLHRHARQTLADHRDLGDRVGPLAGIAAVLAELGGEADVRACLGEQQRGVGREAVSGAEDDRQRARSRRSRARLHRSPAPATRRPPRR